MFFTVYCVKSIYFFTLSSFSSQNQPSFYLSVKNQRSRISKITENLKARNHILILKYLRSASADMSKPIPKLSTMADN